MLLISINKRQDLLAPIYKLDRVAPLITDPPSISFNILQTKKFIIIIWDMWYMTHDM